LTEKLNSLQNGSIRSVSVDRVKQVRHESLVWKFIFWRKEKN
jgi:hypothetical protein